MADRAKEPWQFQAKAPAQEVTVTVTQRQILSQGHTVARVQVHTDLGGVTEKVEAMTMVHGGIGTAEVRGTVTRSRWIWWQRI